jgi:hypothetical protein
MSNDSRLSLPAAYSDPAVKAFGQALRAALSFDQDYASLIDLENVETPAAFGEAITRFMRRNYKTGLKPAASDLERLMSLARTDADVRTLRSAIISYGLVRWDKKE